MLIYNRNLTVCDTISVIKAVALCPKMIKSMFELQKKTLQLRGYDKCN